MAKTPLKAGQYIDTLTQPEVDASLSKFLTGLTSWRRELYRADTYRTFSRQGTADTNGNLVIGGSDSQEGLGPQESTMWGVVRICVTGLAGTTPILRLYRNGADASAIIRGNFTVTNGDASHEFGGPGCVLNPGASLLLVGTGITAGQIVTLSGETHEVPATLGWRLGGS